MSWSQLCSAVSPYARVRHRWCTLHWGPALPSIVPEPVAWGTLCRVGAGVGWWLQPRQVAGGLGQRQHLWTPLRICEHPASSTAGLHFLRREETRVLAPYGCGVMQDQMLAGSRLGPSDVPGQAVGCPGDGRGGKALASRPRLIPSRGPIRVRRAGTRVCPHCWPFASGPQVPHVGISRWEVGQLQMGQTDT